MIWLDMDGVVADFDHGYFLHFGVRPTRWPEPETVDWKLVHSIPDFYTSLPLMPHAHDLFRYVDLLGYGTGFLTGVPRSISVCEPQKRDFIKWHFGPDVLVECCPARDKAKHCKPGDVLVDDYTRYRVDWEAAGGIFIHHTSVADTITEIGELVSWGVIGEDCLPRG